MAEQMTEATESTAANGNARQREGVGEAKGRPMLHWVGKRPLDYVTAYPAQKVERFDPQHGGEEGNLLFHGDNKDVLAWLLAHGYRGNAKVIYIDPPFDSGADYIRKVDLRGVTGIAKLTSENYSLGEQVQYTDIWANDTYLQFMYERLLLLKELLDERGTLWLHCDYHRSHYLKCLCDEVFGLENFITEVIWNRATPRGNVKMGLSVAHDTILVYAKTSNPEWHPPSLEYSDEYRARFDRTDPDGRRYTTDNMISPNPNRPNLDYVWNGVRRVWRVSREKMKALEEEGRIEYTSQGVARYKRYLDELEGKPLTTLWDDISPINSQALEREDYPTQKPESLVERMVKTGSSYGDFVLDCFVGSGTTAAVAQKLGRRWIAADINKGAVQTTSKRLQTIILEQIEAQNGPRQPGLLDNGEDEAPPPASLSFTHYRVNDYDLTIQHNEALQLAAEHIGFQRQGDDPFFEGRLGQRLVRLVPFNHPITRLDLEQVAEELKRRDETRDVVVVGLGKELAVDEWLFDYNRRRPINKIGLIELRTDEKYGQFFEHEPAGAEVLFARQDGKIVVEVQDFISPTIVKRLEMDPPLFRARIPDWRSMVDVILIDASYDGVVFDITLSDVPQRKDDVVLGRYELPAPEGQTTVAVKIIDMLGEEVLVVG